MRRSWLLALVVCLIVALAPAGLAWHYCQRPSEAWDRLGAGAAGSIAQPADAIQVSLVQPEGASLTEPIQFGLPHPTLAERLRYSGHAVLGNVLEQLRCDPTVAGVQWVKAAVHARSVDEMAYAGGGISRTLARSSAPEAVALRMCIEASPRSWPYWDGVSVTLFIGGVRCSTSASPPRER